MRHVKSELIQFYLYGFEIQPYAYAKEAGTLLL